MTATLPDCTVSTMSRRYGTRVVSRLEKAARSKASMVPARVNVAVSSEAYAPPGLAGMGDGGGGGGGGGGGNGEGGGEGKGGGGGEGHGGGGEGDGVEGGGTEGGGVGGGLFSTQRLGVVSAFARNGNLRRLARGSPNA